MRILLDTHAFLWATIDAPSMSSRAREIIASPEHELLLSSASAYELAWKAVNGGLDLPDAAETWLPLRMRAFGISELPITVQHTLAAAALPALHRDPWDRILIAQANTEGVPLLTDDREIARYDVETIW